MVYAARRGYSDVTESPSPTLAALEIINVLTLTRLRGECVRLEENVPSDQGGKKQLVRPRTKIRSTEYANEALAGVS